MKKQITAGLVALFLTVESQSYDISLQSGWNLKGAVENVSTSAFNDACVRTVWTYDREGGWSKYTPGSSSAETISQGKGYWAYANSECTLDSTQQTPSEAENPTTEDVIGGDYTLLAWNDLGMHCMDGNDYSIFSILPPYNNLQAQLIKREGTENKHVTSGVTLTYESTADEEGSINTTSAGKTNFWSYVEKLFGYLGIDDWSSITSNYLGLTQNAAPSLAPKNLAYDSASSLWKAEGIPITPYDDAGEKNYYPMVKVVARDSDGVVIATAKTVLPVSDEMDCQSCHASNSDEEAKPSSGWVNDSDTQKDWKKNILKLHDQKHSSAVSANLSALAALGYDYDAAGLYATATGGTPILCAACHKTNALPGATIDAGIPALTTAIHSKHGSVIDTESGEMLGVSTNRNACYKCHPGSETACLRGAMSSSEEIDCQSCHGSMFTVGSSSREGWLDEPNCGHCHDKESSDGAFTRLTSAFAGTSLREIVDSKFAANEDTPQSGKSLYRMSKGHGNLSCEACHGSTHAEYPSTHANDNVQAIALQGHSGTIRECSACHSDVPLTADGGPHGMHTIGQTFVSQHEHYAEGKQSSCAVCHGSDYRGSFLSKVAADRSFTGEHGATVTYTAGDMVTCYDCHNGPSGH